MTIYDAAERYAAEGVPLVVIAGREYGSGSSRDWAAKGTALLGVRAVIAAELRAHPPLEPGRARRHPAAVRARASPPRASGSTGTETFTIRGLADLDVGSHVTVERERRRALVRRCLARLDAPADVKVYRAGGLLQMVMRQLRGSSWSA